MLRAMLNRDSNYEGVFFFAVKTTGIFCRPTCAARKPKPENVVYFATPDEALAAGFRPCKRCQPLAHQNDTPEWARALLHELDQAPEKRWTDGQLRVRSIDPTRARRWFKNQFGMTFHNYARARRLGLAFKHLIAGENLDVAAFDHGYESVSGFRDAFQQRFGTTPGRGRSSKMIVFTRIPTCLGPMIAGATHEGICLLEFVDRPSLTKEIEQLKSRYRYALCPGENRHLEQLREELESYFLGRLQKFTVGLSLPGTKFQRSVWYALQSIPYGTTCSYKQLANAIGHPNAARAVGRANGENRVAILVPCHRVIKSDGSLSGYGGGKVRKRFLLDHERNVVQLEQQYSIA